MTLLVVAAPLPAQELTLSGGRVQAQDHQHSYSWGLDYQHRLNKHLGLGLSYLNEGHPGNHHRDGVSGQLWLRSRAPEEGPSFAAGLGPYYYFDTTSANSNDSHVNLHGWATLASLTANWDFPGHWFVQMRLNKVLAHKGIDTTTAQFGLGYHLDQPAPRSSQGEWLTNIPGRKELSVFGGKTIVNSLRSERSVATAVEFRRSAGDYAEWTASFLNEGDTSLLRRSGIATQLWMTRPFQNQRLALGVGLGPYFALKKRERAEGEEGGGDRLAGLISLTVRYQLSSHWLARMSWNRVLSQYHRDTDVLLLGAGYSF